MEILKGYSDLIFFIGIGILVTAPFIYSPENYRARGIYISIVLILVMPLLFFSANVYIDDMFATRAAKRDQLYTSYINNISQFDQAAPVGTVIAKEYQNTKDFDAYNSYATDAGYEIISSNGSSSIRVIYKKIK